MTEQIWKEFNKQLLGFIKTRINDDEIANDILQEVFIKIHRNINSVKDNEKITNWVYQITRNSIIDFYRNKKNKSVFTDLNNILPQEIKVQNSDFSKCIIPFIKQLPNKDQEILNKVSFGGISQKEYAEQYNLSYSATKSRVQRAREKLKMAFVNCCDIKTDKYGNIISHTKRKCSDC